MNNEEVFKILKKYYNLSNEYREKLYNYNPIEKLSASEFTDRCNYIKSKSDSGHFGYIKSKDNPTKLEIIKEDEELIKSIIKKLYHNKASGMSTGIGNDSIPDISIDLPIDEKKAILYLRGYINAKDDFDYLIQNLSTMIASLDYMEDSSNLKSRIEIFKQKEFNDDLFEQVSKIDI